MMICVNCKSPLRPGAKFCGKCGEKVVVERRCSNCNNLLEADEIFCTECGTRYDDDSNAGMQVQKTTQAQKATNEASQSFPLKTESCCVNTIKGKMAIIDDTLYFIGSDSAANGVIYSVSLNNGGKASVVLNKEKLFPVFAKHVIQLNINRLHAWNGKLYFSIEVHFDKEKRIFGDVYYFNSIYSYCPKTDERKSVRPVSGDNYGNHRQVFFCDNHAYYLGDMDEETGKQWIKALEAKFGNQKGLYYWKEDCYKNAHVLVTLDLATSQESRSFMPMVAERDWRGNENGSGEIVKEWNNPIFCNGYIYISTGIKGDHSLRFPVNNPEDYEFFPIGIIILNSYGSNNTGVHLFASSNDVIILPNSYSELIALSQATLCPIDGFQKHEYRWIDSDSWQIYGGNYLTCRDYSVDYAKVFDIKKAKYLGGTDWRYCSEEMYDNVYYNNNTYALGKIYGSGGVLYRIPWDKMFKKGTNIEEFGQPLF